MATKTENPLGKQIDAVANLDRLIDRQKASINDLEKRREVLVENLMVEFTKHKIDSAKGRLVLAYINTTKHPTVKDWAAVEAYVYKHKAFDLFQRRITSTAYFDRIENKEKIPGVEVFTKVDMRFKAIKGKTP